MHTMAELKLTLLEILEAAFQSGDVHATQQMGVNVSSAMKREGMVIIQNQNVEVYARIMPSMVRALKLCDAMESSGLNPIEIEASPQPRQLPTPAADDDPGPIEACCSWLFQNQFKWQDMQELMRTRYLEYVIGQFKTKTDAAKWLGIGNTYLCKLSKTSPPALNQN
jgi:hypothetical protein